jgi:penicillin-binding protein 2
VGQGLVDATPLQVLLSGAIIANRGKFMQPTIVREVQDSEGRVIPMWFNPDLADFGIYEQREIVDQSGRTRTVWVNPSSPDRLLSRPPEGSYQISPFKPNLKWDITEEQLIEVFSCEVGYCDKTGETKAVEPETIEAVRTGTRLAVAEEPLGTLYRIFNRDYPLPIAVAGKTGTAEYCDNVASELQQCQFGSWPTHAWTLAYAPFDDPEIAIVAFAYHGGEGGTVAAPIVARVMQAYFELKAIDLVQEGGS